ncbi:MAG: hypothetical protein V4544_07505 [Pseudomonadota bacterium]
MNITAELNDLYTTAKAAGKLDLAFRILACLAKIKPENISLALLSKEDMKTIITECKAISPSDVLAPKKEGKNDRRRQAIPVSRHAHTQVITQQDLPP